MIRNSTKIVGTSNRSVKNATIIMRRMTELLSFDSIIVFSNVKFLVLPFNDDKIFPKRIQQYCCEKKDAEAKHGDVQQSQMCCNDCLDCPLLIVKFKLKNWNNVESHCKQQSAKYCYRIVNDPQQ